MIFKILSRKMPTWECLSISMDKEIHWTHSPIIAKKPMKINNILIFGLMAVITGCSQPKENINYTYVATPRVPAETDRGDAQVQIAEASTAIGSSLEELSAIQLATNPRASLPPLNPAALGMTEVVSVNWNGPAEALLDKIALLSGYRLQILGEEPAIPVLVSINANNQVLAQVLQNVIYQVQSKADVVVNTSRRIIELRYHPA